VEHFRRTGLWDRFEPIEPLAADVEEIALAHDARQIDFARSIAQSGGGFADMDTVISARSWDAAVLAVGGTFAAVDRVADGGVENALCLVRPPGHHATPNRSMGFCIFNNAALAALRLRQRHGCERVLIVDFDVHHGNGTQDIFYEDPSVLYVSLHRSPFYPGTGHAGETGAGAGEGSTVNIPLGADTSAEEYMEHFTRTVEGPVREFRPDFVLISAGFDAYVMDPIGAFCLEPGHFGEMTLRLRQLASDVCGGKVVSTLEGGYNLNVLPELIAAHAEALLG
jgi:acetoin utilization deacetylase AcuC-like enzyme